MNPKLKVKGKTPDLPIGPRPPNYYWTSSLFNEVYLTNDVPQVYPFWVQDESGPFHDFLQSFIDLCIETRSEKFANEASTVKDLILPVMELLGWKSRCSIDNLSYSITESGKAKSYRPDLIYVDEPSEKALLNVDEPIKRLRAGRQFVRIVLEAKTWKRLDKEFHESGHQKPSIDSDRSEKADDTRSLTPVEQTLKYMDILQQRFGILTDGNRWRLLHSELSDGGNKRHFEFTLGYARNTVLKLHQEQNNEEWKKLVSNLKYFFYFFSRNSFYPEDGTRPFVEDILEYSKKYAQKIEEDLKSSFIEAMTIICNGYKDSLGRIPSQDELNLIRSVSESHLFNILFIKSCEVRNILPIKEPPYLKISLSEIIESIEYPRFIPETSDTDELNLKRLIKAFENSFKYTPHGTELYDRVINLYDVVQNGSHGLEVVGFKETVFEPEELEFSRKHKISNSAMVRLLFSLGYTASEVESREYQQIPYNFFTPRQLGSIYESFLEYSLLSATSDMIYHKKKWNVANLESERISKKLRKCPRVKKGQLYFSFNEKERKQTGSYYTPDYIVRHIVSETLGPLVENKSADEILGIRICDPAIGSGHFLNAATEFLTKAYRAALSQEIYDDLTELESDSAQKVLRSCIYGADINSRAVKLAKMGLWLATAHAKRRLEHLDDQLICGDSLDNSKINWDQSFPTLPKNEKFDAVIMNPPYLGIKGNSHRIGYLRNLKEWKHIVTNKYDVFYFFIARAIEITNPDGKIGAITTSYWPTADGADLLRDYISKNADVTSIIFFNNLRLFEAAQGQHNMVFVLDKKRQEHAIKVLELTATKPGVILEDLSGAYLDEMVKSEQITVSSYVSSITNQSLESIGKGSWSLAMETGGSSEVLSRVESAFGKLTDYFHVHSGIETGADRVSKSHLEGGLTKTDKQIKPGDGIFDVSSSEVEEMKLSASELHSYIKPLYKNSDLTHPYFLKEKNFDRFLIHFYNGDLRADSKIYNHLKKYKAILEQRYKFRTEDRLKWFDLHRPLSAEYLDHPKIVSPYRTKEPVFAIVEEPFYSSIDIFYTVPKSNKADLFLACGLLNSSFVKYWLRKKGKMKGEMFELYSTPLGNIPFERRSNGDNQEKKINTGNIAKIVMQIMKKRPAGDLLTKLQIQLDALCFQYYGLSENEAKAILKELSHPKSKEILALFQRASFLKKAA